MSAISLLAVPAMLRPQQSSKTTAQQFSTMYRIGAVTQPPGTLLTSALFFTLAYRSYLHLDSHSPTLPQGTVLAIGSSVAKWKLWAIGGGAVLAALFPFTFVLLEPVSQKLLALAEEGEGKSGADDGEDAQTLLKQWGVLNVVRACLPLVGMIVGFYAVFS